MFLWECWSLTETKPEGFPNIRTSLTATRVAQVQDVFPRQCLIKQHQRREDPVGMGSRWWDCLWKSSRNRSGLLWDSLFVMAPNVVTLRQNQTSASLNWTHVEKLILSRNQIIFLTTVWFWELLEPAWVYKSECGSVLKQRVSPVSGTPWFQQ